MSYKGRRLYIEIDTQEKGPEGLPLITCAPGEEPVVYVKFTFENAKDSKGTKAIARFRAGVDIKIRELFTDWNQFTEYHKHLAKKEGDLGVVAPKPGYLAKGTYTKAVALRLFPEWPSSTVRFTPEVHGWVRYTFTLTVEGVASLYSFKNPTQELEQDFWAVLPGAGTLGPTVPRSPGLVVVAQTQITCELGSWNQVSVNQVVPLHFRYTPCGTAADKQAAVISKVEMMLLQYFEFVTPNGKQEYLEETKVVEVVTKTGWPETHSEAWERTVFVAIPGMEKVNPSFKSKLLSYMHLLKVVVHYQKFELHIAPMPDAIQVDQGFEALPAYAKEAHVVVVDAKENSHQ